MDSQELYAIADREIRLGTFDRSLMAQAKTGSAGVEAVAHQRYWQLRAAAIQEEAKRYPELSEQAYLKELVHRLERESGGRRLRANLIGWMWVLACFASLCGAFVFFRAARGAFIQGSIAQYGYGVAGILCTAMGVVAFVVTKRDAGQDPFAD